MPVEIVPYESVAVMVDAAKTGAWDMAFLGIDPARAVMVEDMVRNLAPAKQLGMTTVWVDNGSERGNHGYDEAIVDVRVSDVGLWLEEILGDGNDD